MAQQNSNISKMWETSLKNPQRWTASVWGPVRCHRHIDFFAPAHSPVGQKTSLVNFKHKITTSTNYRDEIGTGYIRMSHNIEICLHGKRHKNNFNFKINQSNFTCTDAVMKRRRGRGKKQWFFPQDKYIQGTDEKRAGIGFYSSEWILVRKNNNYKYAPQSQNDG